MSRVLLIHCLRQGSLPGGQDPERGLAERSGVDLGAAERRGRPHAAPPFGQSGEFAMLDWQKSFRASLNRIAAQSSRSRTRCCLPHVDLSMRFRGMNGDNVVVEMPGDERHDLAAIVFGAARHVDHLDTYANGVTPEIAEKVGEALIGSQEQIFEIPWNYLSILFRITIAISSRALDTQKIAGLSLERYKTLERGVEQIYDEAFPPEAKNKTAEEQNCHDAMFCHNLLYGKLLSPSWPARLSSMPESSTAHYLPTGYSRSHRNAACLPSPS